jgi:Meiotically up-regulated gene 113
MIVEGIFIFGNEAQGWYKIGSSQSIEHRFAEISSTAALPLKIAAQWTCQRKFSRQLELHLQDLFKDRRIQGEWFALTPEDLITANNAVVAWKANMVERKNSRKLVKQVNVLVEPAMYDQLRLEAFNSRSSISALIRHRLTPIKHDDFLAAVHNPELGKPTLAKILEFLVSEGFLEKKKG